ncbi:MAG: exodeoxyribonuclease VII small subunit [bacterium]|jgi:exodeoxyribonuclease VII small subunit
MAKKKTDEQAVGTENIGFEKALARLETIVEEMESGTLSLEDMMKRFEEGQALVKLCSGKLNQVERRIEILVKEGESVTAEPFADSAAPAEEPADEPGNGLPF